MTDNDKTTQKESAQAAPEEQASQEQAAPKKKKLFRWWGIGLVGGSLILGTLGAEFGFSQTIRSAITSALTDQQLAMGEETAISASLLGGSVAIDDLVVSDQSQEEQRSPYRSDELSDSMSQPSPPYLAMTISLSA